MKNTPDREADEGMPEVELSDEDILDAMQHIAGYIDISTEDFRAVYRLALRHAVERLCGNIGAREPALSAPMTLAEAAHTLEQSGHAALPVVDGQGRVCGMLLRKDFFAAFGWDGPP